MSRIFTRNLTRILHRRRNVVSKELKNDNEATNYFHIGKQAPSTSSALMRTTCSDFTLTNVKKPEPIFPMSNGQDPTPKLIYDHGKRRCGLVGQKVGMTTLWDEFGVMKPVTVLKVVENTVLSARYEPQIGSWMLKIGAFDFQEIWRVPKSRLMECRKFMVSPKQKVVEFEVAHDALLPSGFELMVAHFVPGQFVDVQGISRGKGFQGVMKRWGFAGQPASHGVSLSHRSMGSTGMSTTPGRVFKGKKMPGRMGGKLRTSQSLRVLKVDPHNGLLYVCGAVPGPDRGYVCIKDAVRKLQLKNCFPISTDAVPYPSFMGGLSDLPSELNPRDLTEKEIKEDPMLKVRGELE